MALSNAVNAQTAGVQCLTSAGVWNGRTITAGTGISVSNGDGVSGNPTISATGSSGGLGTTLIYEDFIGQPTAGIIGGAIGNSGLNVISAGSGIPFAGPIEGTSSNPGIITLNTGSANSTGVIVFGGLAGATTGSIGLGGGVVTLDFIVAIPTLSTGTQRFLVRLGLGNNLGTATNTPAQGCYFEYIDNVNSGAWTITNKGAGTSTANTANTADTSFHTLRVQVNAGATSVSYYYDGVQVSNSPIATNVPTQTLCPFIQIIKSVGTTARSVSCDYINLNIALTTPRPG
jgi:hypothetical protein